MKTILAAIVASAVSVGAFAQAASAPMASSKPMATESSSSTHQTSKSHKTTTTKTHAKKSSKKASAPAA